MMDGSQKGHIEGSPDQSEMDRLNALGVLTRREIEARIVGPLLDALGERYGRDGVLEIAREVIIQVARQQGAQIAETRGGRSLANFADSLEDWRKDGALEMEVLEQSDTTFSFNVTRCRYAELYQALRMPELGEVLSCNRDFSLIEGFNPNIRLIRTQTIMSGAPFCDFRYTLPGEKA